MAYAHAAPDPDRLPWLDDDSKPTARSGSGLLLLWALIALVVVAGASFRLGMSAPGTPNDPPATSAGQPSATMSLPEPRVLPPADAVRSSPMPQVRPVAEASPVTLPEREPVRSAAKAAPARRAATRPARSSSRSRSRPGTSTTAEADAEASPASTRLTRWPSDRSAGAAGRLIRVGTFSSSHQAKRGWVHLARAYPGFGGLRAVVVRNPSLRNGRGYYRLQIGTTSQAHSEVLCQRMRMIAQSCVVVGVAARQTG